MGVPCGRFRTGKGDPPTKILYWHIYGATFILNYVLSASLVNAALVIPLHMGRQAGEVGTWFRHSISTQHRPGR
jgi:hypothetical protein